MALRHRLMKNISLSETFWNYCNEDEWNKYNYVFLSLSLDYDNVIKLKPTFLFNILIVNNPVTRSWTKKHQRISWLILLSNFMGHSTAKVKWAPKTVVNSTLLVWAQKVLHRWRNVSCVKNSFVGQSQVVWIIEGKRNRAIIDDPLEYVNMVRVMEYLSNHLNNIHWSVESFMKAYIW